MRRHVRRPRPSARGGAGRGGTGPGGTGRDGAGRGGAVACSDTRSAGRARKRRAIEWASSRHPANSPIGNGGPLRGDLTIWWLVNTPHVSAGRSRGVLTIWWLVNTPPDHRSDARGDFAGHGDRPESTEAARPLSPADFRSRRRVPRPAVALSTHQEFCDPSHVPCLAQPLDRRPIMRNRCHTWGQAAPAAAAARCAGAVMVHRSSPG
jgi:hypothetical protein